MATLIKELIRGYRYLNEEVSDPRTNDWFLMSSPWPVLTLLVVYVYFVYRLGPSLMANRPPMKLDRVMQVYDIIQVILSSYIFYQALKLAWWNEYSFRCEPVDYSPTPKATLIARHVWLYFIIKIMDMVDTIFFVLRKKSNQVSFLHTYHHAGMVVCTWAGVKYFAGGHSTFMGLANSFVHIIMYAHYFIMSLKIATPWWKKYITQLQLAQFFLIFVHFAQLLFVEDCGFPKWVTAVIIPQNLFMIVLFSDFYYKAYIKKPKKPAVQQNGHVGKSMANGKAKSQ